MFLNQMQDHQVMRNDIHMPKSCNIVPTCTWLYASFK